MAQTFLLSRGVLPETAGEEKRPYQSLTSYPGLPNNPTKKKVNSTALTQYSTEPLCLECGCVQLHEGRGCVEALW